MEHTLDVTKASGLKHYDTTTKRPDECRADPFVNKGKEIGGPEIMLHGKYVHTPTLRIDETVDAHMSAYESGYVG